MREQRIRSLMLISCQVSLQKIANGPYHFHSTNTTFSKEYTALYNLHQRFFPFLVCWSVGRMGACNRPFSELVSCFCALVIPLICVVIRALILALICAVIRALLVTTFALESDFYSIQDKRLMTISFDLDHSISRECLLISPSLLYPFYISSIFLSVSVCFFPNF